MKTILLTENEYRKVCKILGESANGQYTKEEYIEIVHNTYDKLLANFNKKCNTLKHIDVETWIAGLYDAMNEVDYAEPTYNKCYKQFGDEPNNLWWDANIIFKDELTEEIRNKVQNFIENIEIDESLNIDMEYFYENDWIRINELTHNNDNKKSFFDSVYDVAEIINDYIDELLK